MKYLTGDLIRISTHLVPELIEQPIALYPDRRQSRRQRDYPYPSNSLSHVSFLSGKDR